MRAIIDTNVLMSGIFFGGPPYEILNAWRQGRFQLVMSAEILDEYQRVGHRLGSKYGGLDVSSILALLAVHSELVASPALKESVCEDPTDDMFFACAVAADCRIIVSGDRHLLKASGYAGVEVVRPREFVDQYLSQ